MSHKFFHYPDGANSMFLKMLKLQSAETLIGAIILVILALSVKLTAPGPVFYRQLRVGRRYMAGGVILI